MPNISGTDIAAKTGVRLIKPILTFGDYEALACFRYALRKFLRFSKEVLLKEGLTPEQYEALLALRVFSNKQGMLVGSLCERLQVKHHTAVGLSEHLMKRKLVTKIRGSEDRREVYIQLTEQGDELLTAMAAIHREEMRTRSTEMIAALTRLQD